MWTTPLGRMRAIGMVEGVSYLVLLLIAMPLKYAADLPGPVMVVGSIHGFLFVLYLLAILHTLIVRKLSFWMSVLAVIASLLPFGPFMLDRKLR